MEIDYDKDYSVEELMGMPLWEFYNLCLWVDSGARYSTNTSTAIRLVVRSSVKHDLAWRADPCNSRSKLIDVWDKDYCEMIERLPDEVVQRIFKELIGEG